MNIAVRCERGMPLSGHANQPYYEELVRRIQYAVGVGLMRDPKACMIVLEYDREKDYEYAWLPGTQWIIAYLDEGIMVCPVFVTETPNDTYQMAYAINI